MPPSPDVIRYLKVKALSEGGSPGERDNAARILRKMESENPGIQRAAADVLRAQKAARNGGPAPPGVWPKNRSGAPARPEPTGNWETIFQYAQAAYNVANDVAQRVVDAQRGRTMAHHRVSIRSKLSRAGNVLITLQMKLETFHQAQRLTPIQQAAFRQVLHELLNQELDDLFGTNKD